ncbi:MAG: LCP family protein [candidate division WOR-3 bacterium]|nr:LCP family protein [candidate division WOR-3 bacterium]MCX7837520.1 LCP family protein [candidate division WOR-3 bacterium]MDW8113832.1 LCP family protein [candidate division WOR-3 bacterium]
MKKKIFIYFLLIFLLILGVLILYQKNNRLLPIRYPQYSSDLKNKANILLIAKDALIIGKKKLPNGKEEPILEKKSRSDIINIIHIDFDKGKVKILNIPRDMLVSIPNYTKEKSKKDFNNLDKINHSYFYGGETLLIKTIKKNFNIDIDRYLTVDFVRFQKLITFLKPFVKVFQIRKFKTEEPAVVKELLKNRFIYPYDDIDRSRNSLFFIKYLCEKIYPQINPLNFLVFKKIFWEVFKGATNLNEDDINKIFIELKEKNFDPKDIELGVMIGYQANVYLNRFSQTLSCYLPIYEEIEKQIKYFIYDSTNISPKFYLSNNESFFIPEYVKRDYAFSFDLDTINLRIRVEIPK